MQSPSEIDCSSNFVNTITNCLENDDVVQAITIFDDDQNINEIKDNSWELIPVITKYLTIMYETEDAEIFKGCKGLINTIAVKSNPEEALLQFVEEIEEATDDTKFVVLLKPMQAVLLRISQKRLNAWAWCFKAIQTYMNRVETLEDLNLEEDDRLTLDTNEIVLRTNMLYQDLIPFYDAFINELAAIPEELVGEHSKIIVKFLIELLGKPLGYLDMSTIGRTRKIAEVLSEKIFLISKDPYIYLEIQDNKYRNNFLEPEDLGLGILLYLVLFEKVNWEDVPKVYNPIYVFQYSLHFINTLLEVNKQLLTEKGLNLVQELLQNVKGLELTHTLLDSDEHTKFCKILEKIIVYSNLERLRKQALSVYRMYLFSFECHGQYLLVYNLISELKHSGLLGFTITQYKEMLVRARDLHNEEDMKYFEGRKLYSLIDRCCMVPEANEYNLIDLSDRIIATLNLIRFVILRDETSRCNSFTDIVSDWKNNYFSNLTRALQETRSYYHQKLNDAERDQNQLKSGDSKMMLTVDNENLVEMDSNEKLNSISLSLTALDIIDSLLDRVIDLLKMKNYYGEGDIGSSK